MKNLVFFYGITLLLFSGTVSAQKVIRNLDFLYLTPGTQYDYKLPKSYKKKKLSFRGNYKAITGLKYKKSKNTIRFFPRGASKNGKAVGDTSAIVVIKGAKDRILRTLNITIITRYDLHKIAKELEQLLIGVDGIEIKIIAGKVVLDGQLLFPKDFKRIDKVLLNYPGDAVVSLIQFSPEAQNKIVQLMKENIDHPNVTVTATNNRFVLEGTVKSQDEKDRIQRVAELYTQWIPDNTIGGVASRNELLNRRGGGGRGGSVLVNLIKVAKPKKQPKIDKIIATTVHYVELRKSFNKGFMFDWSAQGDSNGTQLHATYGGQNFTQGVVASLSAKIQNFFPKLNWAKNFGFARVLHSANLITKEGKEASLSSATNIPVTNLTENGLSSTGSRSIAKVKTVITPSIKHGDNGRNINLKVKIDISSPKGDETSTKGLRTELWVRTGQTAVLGGIFSSETSKQYNRTPDSSAAVSIGTGRNYSTTQSQFVIFITPEVKSSASYNTKEITEKFQLDQG